MKHIVIFADGTGNAFTRQESNVWRLYSAIDLTKADQIAHYVKGVGTSGFRLWATLDAATGLGVPSNVRNAYEYLCRNWVPGDQIFMFGFSRGAFTIRTLIGMIHHEGLLAYDPGGSSEPLKDLREDTMAAWRSYRAKTAQFKLSKMSPVIPIVRWIRDLAQLLSRKVRGRPQYATLPEDDGRRHPPIAFAGLFDTVEAYGVPIEEFRKAIDWGVWPISFRNRILSPLVTKACHALALDDERTTFHPVRIDELPGQTVSIRRIEEVWFAGVHSDVGGGYPDDGLAHVPLVWMVERMLAECAAPLRLIPGSLNEFKARACPFEAIHDSRAGLSTFYRYGPRLFSTDAANAGESPIVHPSVIEKMNVGANLYTPLTLPAAATVWAPSITARIPIATALGALGVPRTTDTPMLSRVLDLIWWRRTNYFALLAAAALTLSLPWTAEPIKDFIKRHLQAVSWPGHSGVDSQGETLWSPLAHISEGTSVVLGLARAPFALLPSYVQPFFEIFVFLPFICGPIAYLFYKLYQYSGRLRDRAQHASRSAWFPPQAIAIEAPRRKRTFAWHMRTSALAIGLKTRLGERLASGAIVVVLYILVLVLLNHIFISYEQGAGNLCPKANDKQFPRTHLTRVTDYQRSEYLFRANERCHATGLTVQKGRPYRIDIEVGEDFVQKPPPTDFPNLGSFDWRAALLLPFRRWWTAEWWQPIARIGPEGAEEYALRPINGGPPSLLGASRGAIIPYEVVAKEDGEVFFFVNDALWAVPFWGLFERAYADHEGAASIAIVPAEYAIPLPK